jgi:plasmid stabilization system protein ParE
MRSRAVEIVGPVEGQVRDQFLYIAENSVDNALAWEERLRTTMAGLGEFAGDAIDEEASDRVGYRVRKRVFEGSYLIHYRIQEERNTVEVVNFRHGARLPRAGEP